MISVYCLLFLIVGCQSLYESNPDIESGENSFTTIISNNIEPQVLEKACTIEIIETKRVVGKCIKLKGNQPACSNNFWLDPSTKQCND